MMVTLCPTHRHRMRSRFQPAGLTVSRSGFLLRAFVQAFRTRDSPTGQDESVEAIRALIVARRRAVGERTWRISQSRVCDRHRARRTASKSGRTPQLPGSPGASRPVHGPCHPRRATRTWTARRLGGLSGTPVTRQVAALTALYGVGPHAAALLLAAGNHPGS
jgi:hypothetical protein